MLPRNDTMLPGGMEGPFNWGVLFLLPITLFGITGNILVCMAVSMEKRLQTVTNYFLLSLAITDLLVCIIVMPISIITEFFGYWPFNAILCNFFNTCDVLMCTSSILHLCTISLQRYLAISNPLKSRNTSKSIVFVKITLIWAAAATISSPVTVLGLLDERNILKNGRCMLSNNNFIIYGSILAFFIPLVIMVLSYSLTVRLLYKQAKLCDPNGSSSSAGQPIIRRSKSRRMRTLDCSETSTSPERAVNSFEMGRRSKSNINISNCDNYLQVPSIISQTASCDSIYCHASGERSHATSAQSNKTFLSVPAIQNPGSSTESLISDNELSTDEDTNQNTKSFNVIGGTESPGKRSLRDVMTKQILGKASSILNLARVRSRDKLSVRTEQKASKVLGFVFFLFVLSWSPFFAVNILTALCTTCTFSPALISTFVWLGWVSSTINPIIYTMFNSTFKQTFIKLLRCKYGFLQKSTARRCWNTTNGFGPKENSNSNMDLPL
uniref:5-HT2-1 n=1 Tax=Sinonovacula constricta TaxID=98310 RepID=A0AA95ZAB8_SINCO|nr:5-HT2-1 [Sinonovacula constricta]